MIAYDKCHLRPPVKHARSNLSVRTAALWENMAIESMRLDAQIWLGEVKGLGTIYYCQRTGHKHSFKLKQIIYEENEAKGGALLEYQSFPEENRLP